MTKRFTTIMPRLAAKTSVITTKKARYKIKYTNTKTKEVCYSIKEYNNWTDADKMKQDILSNAEGLDLNLDGKVVDNWPKGSFTAEISWM